MGKKKKETLCLYWEFGVGRCKLLHWEWINNRALLHTTGNHSQYSVINHDGKEYKKCLHVYNWVALLENREWHNTVNQLGFNKKRNPVLVLYPLKLLTKLSSKSMTSCQSHTGVEDWHRMAPIMGTNPRTGPQKVAPWKTSIWWLIY